jgi:hypothetical protein
MPDEPDPPAPPGEPGRPAGTDGSTAPHEATEDGTADYLGEEDAGFERDPAELVHDGVASLRVATGVIVLKFVAAAILAGLALLAPTRTQAFMALLGWAGLTAYAARDLLLRERLRADSTGVVAVRGLRRVELPWSRVDRVRVDTRSRLGARSELLEIDAGDDTILLFSRYDLGVDPDDAERALALVRRQNPGG